jgi:hypothetical protein
MSAGRYIVVLAAVFAVTGVSVIVAAQPRVSDQQVRGLLNRIDTGTESVRASLDRAVEHSRINGGQTKAEVNQSVKDFKLATDRLHDGVNDRQVGTATVEDVLRRASSIDRFMTANSLDASAQRAWHNLRRNLDELARAYDVTWYWSGSQNRPARLNDRE